MMTGFGLASAAGLNAYIPLLSMGLLDRYTNLVIELFKENLQFATAKGIEKLHPVAMDQVVVSVPVLAFRVDLKLREIKQTGADGLEFAVDIGASAVLRSQHRLHGLRHGGRDRGRRILLDFDIERLWIGRSP